MIIAIIVIILICIIIFYGMSKLMTSVSDSTTTPPINGILSNNTIDISIGNSDVLKDLGLTSWEFPEFDDTVLLKNRFVFDKYNVIKYFSEDALALERASKALEMKHELAKKIESFLSRTKDSPDKNCQELYLSVKTKIDRLYEHTKYFMLLICFVSVHGTISDEKIITLSQEDLNQFINNPNLLAGKNEAHTLKEMQNKFLIDFGLESLDNIPYIDDTVIVNSLQTLEKYDSIKYFKENSSALVRAAETIKKKDNISERIDVFLLKNKVNSDASLQMKFKFNNMEHQIYQLKENALAYRVLVKYVTANEINSENKIITLCKEDIDRFLSDPTLLMSKNEYNQYKKEQSKKDLELKYRYYDEWVSGIINRVNEIQDNLVVKGSKEQIEELIDKLFDITVNRIKKVKKADSPEWSTIENFITGIEMKIDEIIEKNDFITAYYKSRNFSDLRDTCSSMMESQREFNEYIDEKVKTISKLFGTRVIRNETKNDDVYEYIRPHKKTITPFTTEVSATIFSSAENNPIEYIIKYFYPNREIYPQQIQKLQTLIEELETLKEAKVIIDKYKTQYNQYLTNVPEIILKEDEAGFYSRLGFADISEETLTIEYKFCYTSYGGKAKRYFTVPMTEATIVELINALENKLTSSAFTKEQRSLMTTKLRNEIKARDQYTCCSCGNSIHKEPNLLLEIDHIVPVSKGGLTREDNLQTLCWKCNRSKGAKFPLY